MNEMYHDAHFQPLCDTQLLSLDMNWTKFRMLKYKTWRNKNYDLNEIANNLQGEIILLDCLWSPH